MIVLVLAAPATAQYTPGARSLDDVYLPKLGNGGYDALHYDLRQPDGSWRIVLENPISPE